MLVTLTELLDAAEKGGYAVPAFNVYNMETVMGVIDAAQVHRSPVILQCYSRLFTNREAYFLAPIILAAARQVTVPICFHLDHGAGYSEIAKALRYGCTSVMIDASAFPLEKNIAITESVCKVCRCLSVPVEGELGHVGLTTDEIMDDFTKIDEAVEFVNKTGVSALAVLVGTAHGRYRKAPRLDIKRIREIKKAVNIPLVLHGGSGVPDDQLQNAIDAGIRKINFGTDLCYAFVDGIFETQKDTVAIDLFMKHATANVSAFASEKIKLLGAENRV